MAEHVVDRLEIVEIDGEEDERAVASLCLAQFVVEMLAEKGAVRQAGQAVVEGELGDPPLALGDTRGHAVEAAGKPADLVPGLDTDFDHLAPLHALGRLLAQKWAG